MPCAIFCPLRVDHTSHYAGAGPGAIVFDEYLGEVDLRRRSRLAASGRLLLGSRSQFDASALGEAASAEC